MRSLPLAAATVLAAVPASAAGITDWSSHPPPPIDLPSAGQTYVDPVFGSRILRVTDEADGAHCLHAYAYWPALNADDSRLLIQCDGVALLYRFDGATLAATPDGTLQGADGPRVDFEGAYWSGSDPDVLFALGGTRLWRIDVSQRGAAGYTLVRDFAGLFSYPFYVTQLQKSADDRLFTFHSRDPSSGAKLDAVLYDRTTDQVLVYDRAGWEIDETKVDKLGRYVLIDGGDANPGFRVWNLATGAVDDFAWGDPDDKPGGHIDMGATLMVNGDGWNTGLLVRAYDALHGAANLHNIVEYKRPDGSLNWTIADHVSLRADAETFAVGSTYGGDGSWGAFEDEIYLAYTDGSGFVRLAHSRSTQASPDGGWRYYSFPRAVVDHLGRYVVFTSDLGSASRTDVLLLEIPPELWPASAPDPATPDGGLAPPPPAGADAAPGAPDPAAGGPLAGGCRVAAASGRADPLLAALCLLALAALAARPRG